MPRKNPDNLSPSGEASAGRPSALVDTRVIYCGDDLEQLRKDAGELDFMGDWYPIQVKQKDRVGRPDIDSFEAVMAREDRPKGFFVASDYSEDALTEADAFFRKSGRVIVPLTVREILEEHIAKKLA